MLSAALEFGKEFSQKEVSDYVPKMTETLKTIWEYADKGISITNRERAKANIWQTIDPGETKIIAEHLCELGAKSKVVATAIRKVTAAHRMLQIGIITGPRFYQTIQHYKENGGFALFVPPQPKSMNPAALREVAK